MKTRAALRSLVALSAFFALVAGPLYAQDSTLTEEGDTTAMQPAPSSTAQSVVEVIGQDPDLSMLAQALEQTGIANALREGGPYTVFAPSNEAFEQLPEDLRQLIQPSASSAQDTSAQGTTGGQQVAAADTTGGTASAQENRQALVALLRHHVVADNVTSAAAADLNRAVTILGDTLNISSQDGAVTVEEASVERPDLEASNGVIHVISEVLVPAGGVEELVRINQQQEQQSQGVQPPQQQSVQQQQGQIEGAEADTSTFQPEPMEDEMEADTSGVNNR